MPNSVILTESVNALPKASAEGIYRVRIIESNVQGSSGYYSGEMLEAYGPGAFPARTLSHVDHPTLEEQENRPERSVLTLGGYTVSDPIVESDGLYVDMFFGGKAREIVENFGSVIGLSIRASGDIEEAERDGVTIREVKAIHPSPLNSIDLVTIPGAGGKVISALQESIKPTGESSPGNEGKNMDIEELGKKVDALTEALSGFIEKADPILESLKPAEDAEVDVVEAVISANKAASELPSSLRDEVVEAVKANPTVDVAALIESKKNLVESIRTNLEESFTASGQIISGGGKSFTAKAWSF